MLQNLTDVAVTIDRETKNFILDLQTKGVFYGVFPVVGSSMTCEDPIKSIPDKGHVLVYDLELPLREPLYNISELLPLNEAVIIMGTINKQNFCLCAYISYVDIITSSLILSSYNKEYQDQTVPFHWVEHLFKVINVVDFDLDN